MKLAFSTLGCPDWSFEHVLEEAERLGYDAIEIRGLNGVMRMDEMPQFRPESIAATNAALAAHHLHIIGFGASASFHTEERAQAGLEEVRTAVGICAAAGIPMVRVFGDALPDKTRVTETVRSVSDHIASLCRDAEGEGVMICLEIHGEFNTIETVSEVIRTCGGYQSFGIIWDIEHSDEAYGDDWQPFYRLIKPYIKHVHFKDYIRHDDGSFTLCLPGQGDIPLFDIFATLERDGYDGYYSFEWEKKWIPSLPDPEIAFPVYRDLMHAMASRLS